jgi:formylglycine-generating enzyme required for sulfatase activity
MEKAYPLLLAILAVSTIIFSTGPVYSQQKTLTNSAGMTFVFIPVGEFVMGSPLDEKNRGTTEIQLRVAISRSYYLQSTEVTVDQWRSVMGRRLFAKKKGTGDMPVVRVSWHDCQKFIEKLNRKTGERYQLPTEAQWEYAARAGTTTAYFWGNTIDCSRALYANNPKKYDTCVLANRSFGLASGKPAPVKSYEPNAWGLYDMHGNVWEWCRDHFCPYDPAVVKDPFNDKEGHDRVRRGGSWTSPDHSLRSANRAYGHPMSRLQNTGFRLVLEVR